MDEILGFEVHPRLLEAGQDVIVKGDVGLPGVEQDAIAVKGNQFDQTMHPGMSGVRPSANDLASGREQKITRPSDQALNFKNSLKSADCQ